MRFELALGWFRIVLSTICGSLAVVALFDHDFRPVRSVLAGLLIGTAFWLIWAFQYRRATARNEQAT